MNKKVMLSTIGFLLLFSFTSCEKIAGEGPVVTSTYNLYNFNGICNGIDASVYYTQGSVYKVEISAQQNILDQIETPIIDGELRIGYRRYDIIWRHAPIKIYITAPSVGRLRVTGSGSTYASPSIKLPDLSLVVTGSGSINVASYSGTHISGTISGSGTISVDGGSTTSEDLNLSGSGSMDFLGVHALNAKTETSGSGKTTVDASDRLDAYISGSGSVFYSGNPVINSHVSGSGRVVKM